MHYKTNCKVLLGHRPCQLGLPSVERRLRSPGPRGRVPNDHDRRFGHIELSPPSSAVGEHTVEIDVNGPL